MRPYMYHPQTFFWDYTVLGRYVPWMVRNSDDSFNTARSCCGYPSHECGAGSGHIGQGRIVQGIHHSGDASFNGRMIPDGTYGDALSWHYVQPVQKRPDGLFKKAGYMDSTLNTNSLKSHSSPVLKFRIDWIAGKGEESEDDSCLIKSLREQLE